VAPKSLPHKISVPGLSALFGNREVPKPEEKPAVTEPAPVQQMKPAVSAEAPAPAGEGSLVPGPASSTPVAAQTPIPTPSAPAVRSTPIRRMSKTVRVTQPGVAGQPKGRHTLVIEPAVLEELSLLAWAENMSVSAIAREAFDDYLGSRRKAVLQARELRDSFGRKREAV
jgi:hypothetical protein